MPQCHLADFYWTLLVELGISSILDVVEGQVTAVPVHEIAAGSLAAMACGAYEF